MLFCKHEWEVKDKTILPSAWEQHREWGITEIKGTYPVWTYCKKLILTLACKKCGELRVIREENP